MRFQVRTIPAVSAPRASPAIAILVLAACLCAGAAWAEARDFTIVLFPDTQYYMKPTTSVIWMSQCKWVADNREARNIVAVLGRGDPPGPDRGYS
jgi:hypothetical protein